MCVRERKPAFTRRLLRLAPAWFLFVAISAWCGVAAAQQATDDALFWQISKGEHQAGFLLGTIHSEDPRVLDFSEPFMAQLKSCQVYAMEMVPDLPTLERLTDYMHYSDPATLEQTLGTDRFQRVMGALSIYSVPLDWKVRMKVWAVMMTLSVPPPETGFFMDLSLSLRAAGAGLKVAGLETLEQQLSFLEDMPLDYQISLLDQALLDYQQIDTVHHQLVEAYLSGDLAVITQLSDEQFAVLDPAISDYFISLGIDRRNHRMVENLLPLLQESRVFVAVGALHLPGPQGLLALLSAQGYTLTPLQLPFPPGP